MCVSFAVCHVASDERVLPLSSFQATPINSIAPTLLNDYGISVARRSGCYFLFIG